MFTDVSKTKYQVTSCTDYFALSDVKCENGELAYIDNEDKIKEARDAVFMVSYRKVSEYWIGGRTDEMSDRITGIRLSSVQRNGMCLILLNTSAGFYISIEISISARKQCRLILKLACISLYILFWISNTYAWDICRWYCA